MSLVLPAPSPPRTSAREGLREAAHLAGRRAFLRMVSHELRTPLNAVIGYSEIIARELHGPVGDARYTHHASTIRDSGLQLLALVNQVLDIARLEAGAMDLDIRSEALAEVVDEAFAAVAPLAQASGVRLVCGVAPGAPARVLADRRGLDMVLAALLRHVLAGAPAGGSVTLAVRGAPGFAVLTLRDGDGGPGPDTPPPLTYPFPSRTDAASSSPAGLGLPLARLLCRAMNGRLRLSASPAGGAVASVRLPADA